MRISSTPSISSERRTGRTANFQVSYTCASFRVVADVCHRSRCNFAFSRHVNLENCCPSCPSFESIGIFTVYVSCYLSVFSVYSVLRVQRRIFFYKCSQSVRLVDNCSQEYELGDGFFFAPAESAVTNVNGLREGRDEENPDPLMEFGSLGAIVSTFGTEIRRRAARNFKRYQSISPLGTVGTVIPKFPIRVRERYVLVLCQDILPKKKYPFSRHINLPICVPSDPRLEFICLSGLFRPIFRPNNYSSAPLASQTTRNGALQGFKTMILKGVTDSDALSAVRSLLMMPSNTLITSEGIPQSGYVSCIHPPTAAPAPPGARDRIPLPTPYGRKTARRTFRFRASKVGFPGFPRLPDGCLRFPEVAG